MTVNPKYEPTSFAAAFPGLATVTRRARLKAHAEKAYRYALRDAHDAGHSYVEIAKAAGTTRQAVRQLLLREEQ